MEEQEWRHRARWRGASGPVGEAPVGARAGRQRARCRSRCANGRDAVAPVVAMSWRQCARWRGAGGPNGMAPVITRAACWHLQRQLHSNGLWGRRQGPLNRSDLVSVRPLVTTAGQLLRSLARTSHVPCGISRTRRQGGLLKKLSPSEHSQGIAGTLSVARMRQIIASTSLKLGLGGSSCVLGLTRLYSPWHALERTCRVVHTFPGHPKSAALGRPSSLLVAERLPQTSGLALKSRCLGALADNGGSTASCHPRAESTVQPRPAHPQETYSGPIRLTHSLPSRLQPHSAHGRWVSLGHKQAQAPGVLGANPPRLASQHLLRLSCPCGRAAHPHRSASSSVTTSVAFSPPNAITQVLGEWHGAADSWIVFLWRPLEASIALPPQPQPASPPVGNVNGTGERGVACLGDVRGLLGGELDAWETRWLRELCCGTRGHLCVSDAVGDVVAAVRWDCERAAVALGSRSGLRRALVTAVITPRQTSRQKASTCGIHCLGTGSRR